EELQVVQPLDRPRPQLEAAVLGSHRDGAPARGRDEHAGPYISAERERRLAEGKKGNRRADGIAAGADGRRRPGRARALGGLSEADVEEQDCHGQAGNYAMGPRHRENISPNPTGVNRACRSASLGSAASRCKASPPVTSSEG